MVPDLYADVKRRGDNINHLAHLLNTVAMIAWSDGLVGPDARGLAEECLGDAVGLLPNIEQEAAENTRRIEAILGRRCCVSGISYLDVAGI